MWAMASPLLCSELRHVIQRRVEVIFHQETKGAVPPNHAVPLCISNDGLRRQIDEDGRVEAVYRHFKLNRVLWAAERLFSLEETLYKPQQCFRNLYSSNFHQTAWLWRIVTARKSPGFDRMDEWKRALAVEKLRTFPTCFHTSLMAQAMSSLIRSAESTRNLTLWCVQTMLYCSQQSSRAQPPQSVCEGAELHCDSTGNSTSVFRPIKRLKSQI